MAETSKKSDEAANSLGLKAFNQTGRDDTTTKIIRPKVDPQVRNRNIMLTALVVVGMCIAMYIAYVRSGLKISDITHEDNVSFGTAPQHEDRDFDSVNKTSNKDR